MLKCWFISSPREIGAVCSGEGRAKSRGGYLHMKWGGDDRQIVGTDLGVTQAFFDP